MWATVAIVAFFLFVHYTNKPRHYLLNNPFALALAGEYVHHRSPPPVPNQRGQQRPPQQRPRQISPRSPHDGAAAPPRPAMPPPLYEEAAGPQAARSEYPREKALASSLSRAHTLPQRRPTGLLLSHRHRERRLSDSSVDQRRSHRDRDRDRRRKKRSPKKPEPVKLKNLDTIDKLDVTAFFGGGFHHDGPFDACAPHRNKNTTKLAPVEAFPIDGPNNSLTLFPQPKDQTLNLAFGNYDPDQGEIVGRKALVKYGVRRVAADDDDDTPQPFTGTTPADTDVPHVNPKITAFNANGKAEEVHGVPTAGLGSLTFIDGAPAPRLALQGLEPPLGRKKLLVYRLRKNLSVEDTLRRSSVDDTDNDRATLLLIRRVKSLKVRR